MPIPLLRCAAAGIMLLSLGGCIAGAGRDREADREAATAYRQFRARLVAIHVPAQGSAPAGVVRGGNHFAQLDNHVNVPLGVETRMGRYTFFTTFTETGRVIRAARDGQQLLREVIPRVFYMGDLQAAAVQVGGSDYLLFTADTRATTGRRWLGIYRADGSPVYAESLKRSLLHVRPDADGVSLFFFGGDSMQIRF